MTEQQGYKSRIKIAHFYKCINKVVGSTTWALSPGGEVKKEWNLVGWGEDAHSGCSTERVSFH